MRSTTLFSYKDSFLTHSAHLDADCMLQFAITVNKRLQVAKGIDDLLASTGCYGVCLHDDLLAPTACYGVCLHDDLLAPTACYGVCLHDDLLAPMACYGVCLHDDLLAPMACYGVCLHDDLLAPTACYGVCLHVSQVAIVVSRAVMQFNEYIETKIRTFSRYNR